MSNRKELPVDVARRVRDQCLCLHVQRAARAIARRYDQAFRPLDLTNWQFSLLVALNRPQPPNMGQVADVLAVDRTTLTANLKPLERRGLVKIVADEADKRSRRLQLTAAGKALLVAAIPVWERVQAEMQEILGAAGAESLRATLRELS